MKTVTTKPATPTQVEALRDTLKNALLGPERPLYMRRTGMHSMTYHALRDRAWMDVSTMPTELGLRQLTPEQLWGAVKEGVRALQVSLAVRDVVEQHRLRRADMANTKSKLMTVIRCAETREMLDVDETRIQIGVLAEEIDRCVALSRRRMEIEQTLPKPTLQECVRRLVEIMPELPGDLIESCPQGFFA